MAAAIRVAQCDAQTPRTAFGRRRMSFGNRTVIVTGAAGNLGKAVGQAFAELGANLVLVDLKREALENAFGPESDRRLVVPANLLQTADATALAQAALARFGRID